VSCVYSDRAFEGAERRDCVTTDGRFIPHSSYAKNIKGARRGNGADEQFQRSFADAAAGCAGLQIWCEFEFEKAP
jgi:hypothetical protein